MTAFTTKNVDFRVNQPDGAIATRREETFTVLAIPSLPFFRNFSIVFGGQLQGKLYIAMRPLGMGDEFHLGTVKKNIHPFNRYINHPLWSFSSTQNILPCRILIFMIGLK